MIRTATVEDAAGIAAVHVGSWERAYRGLLPDEYLDDMDVARRTSGWQRALTGERPPGAATLVAVTADGVVLGFADVVPSRDDDAGPDTGELTLIYAAPAAWGTGVGRELMAAAVDRLREAGFRAATLWVLRDNQRARPVLRPRRLGVRRHREGRRRGRRDGDRGPLPPRSPSRMPWSRRRNCQTPCIA